MGNFFAYGARTFESTPIGLFIGTANPYYGLDVWRHSETLDLDAPMGAPATIPEIPSDQVEVQVKDASMKVAGLIETLIRAMETRVDATAIAGLLTQTARAVQLNSPDRVALLTMLQSVIASLGEMGSGFTVAELNSIVRAVEKAVLSQTLPTVMQSVPKVPLATPTQINQLLLQGTTLLQQSTAVPRRSLRPDIRGDR